MDTFKSLISPIRTMTWRRKTLPPRPIHYMLPVSHLHRTYSNRANPARMMVTGQCHAKDWHTQHHFVLCLGFDGVSLLTSTIWLRYWLNDDTVSVQPLHTKSFMQAHGLFRRQHCYRFSSVSDDLYIHDPSLRAVHHEASPRS